jgi:cephalosporin-C deacetylase
MPLIDKPIEELKVYRGISPVPADFDAYWNTALRELDATDPEPELVPSDAIRPTHAECFDLWFRGVGGARIYAKYIRPKSRPAPGPALLQFHGYSANSGDWIDKLAYAGQGLVVAALDCRRARRLPKIP